MAKFHHSSDTLNNSQRFLFSWHVLSVFLEFFERPRRKVAAQMLVHEMKEKMANYVWWGVGSERLNNCTAKTCKILFTLLIGQRGGNFDHATDWGWSPSCDSPQPPAQSSGWPQAHWWKGRERWATRLCWILLTACYHNNLNKIFVCRKKSNFLSGLKSWSCIQHY